MKCEWVRENIVLQVYGELADDVRYELEQHVARCAECAAELKAEQDFHALLSQDRAEDPTPNLLASSRMQLQEALETAEQGKWWSRLAFDPVNWLRQVRFSPALASAILILGFAGGVGMMYEIYGHGSRTEPVPIANNGPQAPQPSIAGIQFQNLDGPLYGLAPNSTHSFDVKVTGDGDAHSFDIQFVTPGTSVVAGSIPAAINRPYQYDADAVDVDGDALNYELVNPSSDFTINSQNGLLTWRGATLGEHTIEIELAPHNRAVSASHERTHGGNAEAKHLNQPIPLHHDFGRLKGMVHDSVPLRVIERLADLASHILQIPDRETFVSRQRGGYRISLHVLGRGPELIAFLADFVNDNDVVAA